MVLGPAFDAPYPLLLFGLPKDTWEVLFGLFNGAALVVDLSGLGVVLTRAPLGFSDLLDSLVFPMEPIYPFYGDLALLGFSVSFLSYTSEIVSSS